MSGVLVTPTKAVPLGAVAAAAIDIAGRERVWLDTGGSLGIRVPDGTADEVWALAQVMAGVADPPAPEDPADGPAGAPATPAPNDRQQTPDGPADGPGRAPAAPAPNDRQQAPEDPADSPDGAPAAPARTGAEKSVRRRAPRTKNNEE